MTKLRIIRRTDYIAKDGLAPLNATFILHCKKIRIPIGIRVSEDEWDEDEMRVTGNSKLAQDYNLIIENTRSKINEIFVRHRLSGEPLDKLNFLKEYQNFDYSDDFHRYAQDALENNLSAISQSTERHHRTVLAKVKEFSPTLKFCDITSDWVRSFMKWLADEKGNRLSTIRKNLSMVRVYCDRAYKEGKMANHPFDEVKLHSEQSAVVFLKESEVHDLVRLYHSGTLPDNRQDALRFFLFMLFTGMHISDARALTIEQTFDDRIVYRRMKTGTHVVLPMSEPVRKLVDYYAADRVRGKLFRNLPTDQAFNRLFKLVARAAGIRKPVSAKTGRHTFATLYLTKNPGDITTLSRLLGHTNIETTMTYIHTLREDKEKGVSNAFDGMF